MVLSRVLCHAECRRSGPPSVGGIVASRSSIQHQATRTVPRFEVPSPDETGVPGSPVEDPNPWRADRIVWPRRLEVVEFFGDFVLDEPEPLPVVVAVQGRDETATVSVDEAEHADVFAVELGHAGPTQELDNEAGFRLSVGGAEDECCEVGAVPRYGHPMPRAVSVRHGRGDRVGSASAGHEVEGDADVPVAVGSDPPVERQRLELVDQVRIGDFERDAGQCDAPAAAGLVEVVDFGRDDCAVGAGCRPGALSGLDNELAVVKVIVHR